MLLDISRPLRSAWRMGDRVYALVLFDLNLREPVGKPQWGSGSEAVHEFIFDINPKSLELDEQAAVTIVPTQNGGKYVEHQGGIFKDIRIGGTTGLRPFAQRGSIVPVIGIPSPFAQAVDQETLLPPEEKTGFDVLIELRNLFRTYWSLKKDPTTSHNIVMVWQNGHEGDFYIVEPLSFNTRRDSRSPFTFNYEIQLKTIERYDAVLGRTLNRILEEQSKNRSRAGVLGRVNNFTNNMKRYTSFLGASVNSINNLIGNTAVTLLNVPNQVIGDAANLLTGLSRTLSIPRGLVAHEAAQIWEFVDAYDEFRRETDDGYFATAVLTELSQVSNAFKKLARNMDSLVNEPSIWGQAKWLHSVHTRYSKIYRSNGQNANSGRGSVQNFAAPGATQKAKVQVNETIHNAARRLLGDAVKWKDLVILNGLKAPYISEDGDGISVLRPGDSILFPAVVSSATSSIRGDIDVAEGTDPFVRSLGRDLKVKKVAEGGNTGLFDLDTSAGDLATTEGVPNMEQATLMKFSIERGDLPEHPSYGISLPIGTKGLIRSMLGYQIDARSCLLADSRVEEVNKLNFRVEGDTVNVQAVVRVKGVDSAISLGFSRGR